MLIYNIDCSFVLKWLTWHFQGQFSFWSSSISLQPIVFSRNISFSICVFPWLMSKFETNVCLALLWDSQFLKTRKTLWKCFLLCVCFRYSVGYNCWSRGGSTFFFLLSVVMSLFSALKTAAVIFSWFVFCDVINIDIFIWACVHIFIHQFIFVILTVGGGWSAIYEKQIKFSYLRITLVCPKRSKHNQSRCVKFALKSDVNVNAFLLEILFCHPSGMDLKYIEYCVIHAHK